MENETSANKQNANAAEKASKLLALAKGAKEIGSLHEAIAAQAAAARLMRMHGLAEEQVNAFASGMGSALNTNDIASQVVSFEHMKTHEFELMRNVFNAILKALNIKVVLSRTKQAFVVYAHANDIDKAIDLAKQFVQYIERFYPIDFAAHKREHGHFAAHGKTYRKNYNLGATKALRETLDADKAKQEAGLPGLMVIGNALVKAIDLKMKSDYPNLSYTKRKAVSVGQGFNDGISRGQTFNQPSQRLQLR
jgi:hypothetical protein